jgi:hypothetical protein
MHFAVVGLVLLNLFGSNPQESRKRATIHVCCLFALYIQLLIEYKNTKKYLYDEETTKFYYYSNLRSNNEE